MLPLYDRPLGKCTNNLVGPLRAVSTPQLETRALTPDEIAVLREAVGPVLVTVENEPTRAVRGAIIGALISSAFWVLVGAGLVWWL